MGQIEKLIKRFLSKPKDLTWSEFISVLRFYGYMEMAPGKTGGSRRKFVDGECNIISLHKPHPTPIVKVYVIEQVIANLKENGKLND